MQRAYGDSYTGSNRAETSGERIRFQFSPGQMGIRLTLPVDARVDGVVVEKTTGRPLGGVKVTAGFDQMEDGFVPPDPVTTAEDGTFHVSGLLAGSRSVQLAPTRGEVAEWAAEPVEVDLKADETKSGVRLLLTKGGIVEVLLRDGGGEPITQAVVDIRHIQRDYGYTARTDKNGLARMRVPSGQYRVSEAAKIGYALQMREQQVIIEEGETKRVEFVVNVTAWK